LTHLCQILIRDWQRLYYSQDIEINHSEDENYYSLPIFLPQDPDFCCQLAQNYVENNQFDEAIVLYQMALELKPNDGEIQGEIEQILGRKNYKNN
jgi:tetratricopeptide (TPR) repeat protein